MPQLGSFWMIICAISFALMSICVKLLGSHFSTPEIVFWRMLPATILLLLIAKLRAQTVKTVHIKSHITRALLGTGALTLNFFSITHLPLATAVTLTYTSVIWMAALSVFLLKRKVSIFVFLCAVLGLIGVIILLRPSGSSRQTLYILLGTLTGMLSALAYIQVKELTLLQEPEWRIVFYFSLIAACVTGIWSAIIGFHPIDYKSIELIAGLSITSLIGQLAMTLAYSQGDLLISSIFSYLTIIFSFVCGAVILGEKLGAVETLGILIILSSGILSSIADYFNLKKRDDF